MGNPLLWLHIKLSGNWRATTLIVAAYFGLVLTGAMLSYRLIPPADHPRVDIVWLIIMTALQALFLLLLGPGAIRRAILRDFQTGMIESHRISPMSGSEVAAGYLTGPVFNLLALVATGALLGTYFAMRVSTIIPGTVASWWAGLVCMGFLALFLSSMVLLGSLATRGKANIVGLLIPVVMLGGWAIVAYVPGLALLGGVMTAANAVKLIKGGTAIVGDPRVAVWTVFAQLVFSTIFLIAAAEKVHSPQRPLFNLPLVFVLMLASALLLFVGVKYTDQLVGFAPYRGLSVYQIIGSTVVFMAVAQFALISASVERFRVDCAAALGDAPGAAKRIAAGLTPYALTLIAMLLIAGVYWLVRNAPLRVEDPYLEQSARHAWPAAAIALALLMTFLTDANLIYVGAARRWAALRIVVVSAIVLKALPLLLDGAVIFVSNLNADVSGDEAMQYVQAYFSGASPIGTLILCAHEGGNPWPGLAAQIVIMLASAMWAMQTRRRLTRRVAEKPLGQIAEAV